MATKSAAPAISGVDNDFGMERFEINSHKPLNFEVAVNGVVSQTDALNLRSNDLPVIESLVGDPTTARFIKQGLSKGPT
jgi:hypothetical protein